MKKLLITGFEPFGEEDINAAWETVKRLPDVIGEYELKKMELPVVFGRAAEIVWEEQKTYHPDVIICVGQAAGRASVTPEMVAINLRHGRIPDNDGNQPKDEPVEPNGPKAYFTTLPIREMTAAADAAGLPCAVSYSAGTYVCNDIFYEMCHRCEGTDIRAGFIHVPITPEQAKEGMANLSLDTLVETLTAVIAVL